MMTWLQDVSIAVRYWRQYLSAIRRLRDYMPQPVCLQTLTTWIKQFDEHDRDALFQLLSHVIYLSERDIATALVSLNQKLLDILAESNITLHNIIYIQLHDPGSSSPVMLNTLRDRALLERSGCYFIDSKNVRELNRVTTDLSEGAIVYVDDFAGTGHQFCASRDHLAEYIVGNFSEFFLLPRICEEAIHEIELRGVQVVCQCVHLPTERPLHLSSSLLDKGTQERLRDLSFQIDKKWGLGYRNLASMIVYHRNAPNGLPLLLRGSPKQSPWKGILPRTTDLSQRPEL